MNRTLVFMALGPTAVFVTVLLVLVAMGVPSRGFVQFAAVTLFFVTLFVAAITRPIDDYLARSLPPALRAPLTAIVGALSAGSLATALWSMMLPHISADGIWTPFGIGGAVSMGVCSLLSHDYGFRQRHAARMSSLPSRAG